VKGSNGERPAAPPACPVCEGPDHRLVGTKGSLALWKCRVCTLVFTHPQPTMDVTRKYLDEYDLAVHFDAVAARKRVLFERRLRLLEEQRRGGGFRLCDVGCAGGQFLELAQEYGWRPFGVEMNPPAAARTRALGATVFEGPFEEMKGLPWQTFDLVTCWDTLEHSPRPRLFAERLARLLKRGGVLALTTLNWRSLARMTFGMQWSMIVEDHFTYWDRQSLTRLFRPLGLELCEVETFGLGRDFLKAIDRRVGSMEEDPSRTVPRGASKPNWDTHPVVLTAESLLNQGLLRLGGGVGIRVTLQRP
jgi:2-polyprenyl-3-methyl-5-hydroxy-6-metoxy-1,4-benzoquinol methylase